MSKSKAQRAAEAAAKAATDKAVAEGKNPVEAKAAGKAAALATVPAAIRQQETGSKGRAGERVTVCCKLPNGLLLRNFTMVDRPEPVLGGGTRMAKIASQIGETVRINGTRVPFGETPSFIIAGGYALTPNVSAEFFARWLKDNHDHDAVVNRLIFAEERSDDAQAHARELKATRSGLEPINPNPKAKDPRMPKKIEAGDREEAA